ncbi:PucR family transcriptional regulator [Kribbella sp. NPDC051620]|uniref:PucR family transcriptional regulator n=1 Tax=Kribbella sp. NPDC051620 TaxID=3364120 RepID=UPI0037B4041D
MWLESLLSRGELGLQACVDVGEHRSITGAQVVEIEDPGRWILPGCLALTTGVAFTNDVEAQTSFVRSLQRADASALGYALGNATDEPPPGLIVECRRVGMPLFTVPFEVSLRDVVTTILGETFGPMAVDRDQVIEMQDFLLASLDHREPQQELIRRLCELLGTPVAVVGTNGMVLTHAGDAAQLDLIAEVSRAFPGDVQRADRRFLVSEVQLPLGAPLKLVIALGSLTRAENLARSLSRFTCGLLKMIAMSRRLRTELERRMSARVCRALLDPSLPKGRKLRDEAACLGLTGEDAMTVLRISGLPAHHERGEEDKVEFSPSLTVHDFLDRLRIPYIAAPEGCIHFAIAQGKDIEKRIRELSPWRAFSRIAVGLSSPTSNFEALPHLATEAQLAHRHLDPRIGEGVSTAMFHGTNVADLLLAYVPSAVRHNLMDVLAPLDDKPDLIATLRAYLDNRRDVTATGAELYLHPNTVRYRLAKVETLIGRSLDETDLVVAIHVALRDRVATGLDGGSARRRVETRP